MREQALTVCSHTRLFNKGIVNHQFERPSFQPGMLHCAILLIKQFIYVSQTNDGLLHLYRHLFGHHIESSGEQPPNAASTHGINSRSFICLACHMAIKLLVSQTESYNRFNSRKNSKSINQC